MKIWMRFRQKLVGTLKDRSARILLAVLVARITINIVALLSAMASGVYRHRLASSPPLLANF
jgi:hypothetical protein